MRSSTLGARYLSLSLFQAFLKNSRGRIFLKMSEVMRVSWRASSRSSNMCHVSSAALMFLGRIGLGGFSLHAVSVILGCSMRLAILEATTLNFSWLEMRRTNSRMLILTASERTSFSTQCLRKTQTRYWMVSGCLMSQDSGTLKRSTSLEKSLRSVVKAWNMITKTLTKSRSYSSGEVRRSTSLLRVAVWMFLKEGSVPSRYVMLSGLSFGSSHRLIQVSSSSDSSSGVALALSATSLRHESSLSWHSLRVFSISS
mmetsp:Transcript_10494/g.17761  ORF Transcript_10494/g.17761 Transcript_10494/m.17761 type:complete len:256 (+) Transcript_10494:731-1498(+)